MEESVHLLYPKLDGNTFGKETLKERLQYCLKEVKIGRSNPDGGVSACLENNETLE